MNTVNNLRDNTLLQGGKYRILRYISSGGFGCTYEALHVMLNKSVAIKEFFVKDFCNRDEATNSISVGTHSKVALVSKLKNKFVDEARSISGLNHPNIVQVSDVFEENGTAYYVMDYIDGRSVGELVKANGPIPEQRALQYIHQVADALRYVHNHNRLHLDIKPGNIMINDKGDAILIDFGASKQYDEEAGQNTSTLMGQTPGYAPIEQMGNNVTEFLPATDIYALGATMYRMLTGKTPVNAYLRASGQDLVPLPEHISPATRNAVMAALNMRKSDRPQSIEEFEAILSGENITAAAGGAGTPPPPHVPGGGYVSPDSKPENDEYSTYPAEEETEFHPADGGDGTGNVAQPPMPPYNPPAQDIYDKPNKTKRKVWLIVLISLLAAAGITVGVLFATGVFNTKPHWEEDDEEVEEFERVYYYNTDGDRVTLKGTHVEDMVCENSDGDQRYYTGDVKVVGDEVIPHGEGRGWTDTYEYVGEFSNGVFEGRGKLTDKEDDSTYEGTFKNGTIVNGTLTVSDGSYYTGTFDSNGKFINGTTYNSDGEAMDRIIDGEEQ